jgi:hypothetical protein
MFINMVPGHPFNEMKPNSGGSELELDSSTAEILQIAAGCN